MRTIIRQILFTKKKQSSSTFPGLTHRYRLNNSYVDDFGGSSLVPLGGTLSSGGYSFPAKTGLNLSNAIVPNNYSILIDCQFSNVNSYNKIIDFANLTQDNGIYSHLGRVGYDGGGGYSGTVITVNTPFRFVVTMSSVNNSVALYVNGSLARGSLSAMVFGAANQIIRFFQDDNISGGNESMPGIVTQIAIFNRPLTPVEITTIGAVGTAF